MYFAYSLVLYLLVPLVLIRLYFRSWKIPAYIDRWPERFGFILALPSSQDVIWIHAVSVGEVQASRPLVEYLQKHYPDRQILLSTTTPTGTTTVAQVYADTVSHRYFPYDLPITVARFLRIIQPKVLLVLETEIWPNLYRQCRQQNIPVVLINARLSEKSMKGYRLFSALTRSTLEQIAIIATQSSEYADRFIQLGAPAQNVQITGNIKFDIRIPHSVREQGEVVRRYFSSNRPVWIAASTHEREDEIILEAFQIVQKKQPNCLLVLVPRHPERFPIVRELCINQGYTTACYTDVPEKYSARTQVFLLDVLGQLPIYYAAADVAFVGGSLVPAGGHNMLEPAFLGLPIITGEYLFNFNEVANLLSKADALYKVNDASSLADQVLELLGDANLRFAVGERAKSVVIENQGSINKIVKLLEQVIP